MKLSATNNKRALKSTTEPRGKSEKSLEASGEKSAVSTSGIIKIKTNPASLMKSMQRLQPMLAEVMEKPFDNDFWIYEVKFDGYRALASIHNKKVDLYSRNLKSFNESYRSVVNELSVITH